MKTKTTKNDALKAKIHEIFFEADTPLGKFFDIALLIMILLSIVIVMLESVSELNEKYGDIFFALEWILTILFTIEYALRLYSVKKPLKYATSFFGIIDLLAIIPTYLDFVVAGSHYFLTVRALRLLRVFRIFKLARYLGESNQLLAALIASRIKIIVFLGAVVTGAIIIGSIMYFVEAETNSEQFTSIPRSVYWAIVTITTVGYGDISPQTNLGQFLAALLMIVGYGVIAVPTGIVSAEITKVSLKEDLNTRTCPSCCQEGHDNNSVFCKHCGEELNEYHGKK
ncbi:MAG: ion transporter [Chitinophagales bacterium]